MKKNIIIIISLLMFIAIFILYKFDSLNFIDSNMFNFVIKMQSNNMTSFMKFITFFASTKFFIVVMIILLVLSLKIEKFPIIIDLVIIGEVLLNNLIKIIVRRDRPKLINLVNEKTFSFPSGHTMIAIVFYGFLIYLILKSKYNKYVKILLTILLSILILLIMFSRIYLGAHFASDVMAGLFLGISYLLIMIKLLERKKII